MDTFELIQRMTIALAIGLVIGIERGWQQREEAEGERAVGLRTHALAGLLGGAWGAIARGTGDWGVVALGLAFMTFAGAIVIFRLRELEHDKTFGATTVVAAMIAFALGAMAVLGDQTVAAAAGVAVAVLLALKTVLHTWLKRLTWEELRAGLILLAMTVILLPVLPDREIAAWLPINPREVWLLTILIAALSFAGYVAIRVAGPQLGIPLSGIAGGLVSSTATTLNMGRLARQHTERTKLFAAAILLSSAVMMLRVIFLVGVVNASLLQFVAPPLVLAVLAQGVLAGYLGNWTRSAATVDQPLSLRNPFDLGVVLAFGALLAIIMVLTKLLAAWAGAGGAIALAAISGTFDVDAISLSLARLVPGGLDANTAACAILVAVIANSLTKIALAWTTGGAALGRLFAGGVAAALVSGGIGLWVATAQS
ncbi:MAG: MgtC/SapB family protein [Alphaproteobacteria bacterium]